MPSRIFPHIYNAQDVLRTMGIPCRETFSKHINILVWNMYKGRRGGWAEDFRAISEGRDIVLLQEAVVNTRYDPIFTECRNYEWVMAVGHGNRKTKMETGVKTGAIVKSSGQSFLVTPDYEPFLGTPKMLLATTYPVGGGGQLLVVNIHAINFVSYDKFNRQMRQVIEAIERHEGPVILAGDFNTWNAPRYKGLAEITQALGLIPVPVDRKASMRHFNRHLDYIFYRGLKFVKAEALSHILSSDHMPLSAEFIL